MSEISKPPVLEKFNQDGSLSQGWQQWMEDVRNKASTAGESGTTANRPTTGLFVGRRFFDSTLGHPIYLKTISPVVWVDGTGTVV